MTRTPILILSSIKRISYFDRFKETKVYIEEVASAAYGCYIWPSALVMADFIWFNKERFSNRIVLEVGAGTSLPSLVLLQSPSPPRIIVSDTPSILPVSEACLALNGIKPNPERVWLKPLEWSQCNTENNIDSLISEIESNWNGNIDYIIGSDTFYDPSEFENLLVLVSFIIHKHNPHCTFYTTYQERSSKRSIQYLLDKWKLKCRLIPRNAFQFDEQRYTQDDDISSQIKTNAGILTSVFLLEIYGG
ncbi:hypothetical protein K501DRAFT_242897 [Backusella circina FSU 941]|nr:hypothetical protein K501DRAFT_242897 [Backusella circina FSU 941]